MSAPVFDIFTDAELAAALRVSPRYAEAIKAVQAARAAAQQQSGASSGRGPMGEPAKPESAGQGSKTATDRKAAAKKGKKSEEWDQFEANSKLFGVSPAFDMDEYASPIDTKSTTYKRDLEKSAKIASEIMNQKTDDMHRLEERGVVKNGDTSDERLFSTVRDGGRWERRSASGTDGGAGKKSEEAEKIISISAKNTTESKMEEELNKQKEILNETINESPNPEKMWASLNKFLSLKKQVQDSSNTVPPGEPKAAEAEVQPSRSLTPEGRPAGAPAEQAKNKQPRVEKSESRQTGGYSGPQKDGKADRETSRNYKPNGKEAPAKSGYKGYRKQDDSSDVKASKQVIIGNALRYKNADEFIGRIISKFVPPGAGSVRESWGKGCMIEDKIEYIKKKQMCILPSEQRLSEILSFALYRNKK